MCFSLIFCDFSELSSAASLVFYLPGRFTHTDTEGKQRKARVRNNFKNSEKTQYLMNTVYLTNNLLLLKLRIMWQINCVGPPFTDNQPRLYQSHINVFLCVCFVYVYVYVCGRSHSKHFGHMISWFYATVKLAYSFFHIPLYFKLETYYKHGSSLNLFVNKSKQRRHQNRS